MKLDALVQKMPSVVVEFEKGQESKNAVNQRILALDDKILDLIESALLRICKERDSLVEKKQEEHRFRPDKTPFLLLLYLSILVLKFCLIHLSRTC
jgi:hypothetical protein